MVNFIEQLYFAKINEKNYGISFIEENKELSKLTFQSPWLKAPFGLEEFKNRIIINLELSKNSAFYKKMKNMDNFFKELKSFKLGESLIDISKKKYNSFLRERGKYNPLIKLKIKKTNKCIITKCFTSNKNIDSNAKSIYTIKKGDDIKVNFEIGSLWVYEDSYGIFLNINIINL